ncbi:T9SS type A sorting domain-containing protein [Paracnuella aquatica]|uniref:T9SS type A sorting domain-containing protein n=1 Tax=Paracnuella aquatica TaxID=2268757 RepID=UPI00138FA9ED|nr:T9SS type A sorting domain-containing protein [Paracnuella aquatica]
MKRILPILSFILLITTQTPAQPREGAAAPSPIVRFYPNPATSFVTFDFQKEYERGYSIQVFSFLGKKMYESANLSQKTTINLSDFNRGIYIYQLYDRTGKLVESGKFQKNS